MFKFCLSCFIHNNRIWSYFICSIFILRIAGNFRGRKLSRILRFLISAIRESFSIMRPILTFREMLLTYPSAKVFSLENFPLYGTYIQFHTYTRAIYENGVLSQQHNTSSPQYYHV